MNILSGLLGDPTHDDGSYGGETDPGMFSVQYYRDKATQFQTVMNSLDQALYALGEARDVLDDNDTESIAQWESLWTDAMNRREWIRGAAEAVNLASEGLNAVGVRFPMLSVPSTLQGAPLVAVAAAIAVTAAVVSWAYGWFDSVTSFMKTAIIMNKVKDPDKAAILFTEMETAKIKANSSATSSIADMIKWVGIGVAGYLVYKELDKRGII